jgi:O-antigen ligase
VETGALGFLSFIGIYIVLFWQIIKTVVKTPPENRVDGFNFTVAFLISLPVAYLVQGIVLFDVLSTYIQIFLFLAFAAYKIPTLNKEKNARR